MALASDSKTSKGDELIAAGIIKILRAGVIASTAIVLIGCAIYLWDFGLQLLEAGRVPNEQETLSDLKSVINSTLTGHGRGIMQLGILVLIGTPIARVAYCFFAYLKQGDRAYTIITGVVLFVLCYSLLVG
jgi:uncharacterized membrane protein